tara:strand:- start:3913 stop:5076 length:1164 start_codon:yes stop_codon:yes gene_type:complete
MHAAIADDLAVADSNVAPEPAETSTHTTDDAIAMQKLRLNEAQWARILADNGQMGAVRTPNALSTGLRAHDRSDGAALYGLSERGSVQQVAYLLSLEGDEPHPKWTWYETALDALVQSAQPAPAMTHTELLLPPENADEEMHFAIYLGKQAHWGSVFGGGKKFYLDPQGNAKSWRAVPVVGQDAVLRLRAECSKHSGTPYGPAHRLFNYPFSMPPGRSLAWLLDDSVGSPAHCASLTARCLRRALPELGLSRPSAWYGPSTLYLELTRESRMTSYKQYLSEAETVKATVEVERAAKSADTLLRGSDDAVVALSHEECQCGVNLLTSKVVDASIDGDPTAERLMQKNLARALLRWSQINRGDMAHAGHDAATGHGDGEAGGPSGGMFR